MEKNVEITKDEEKLPEGHSFIFWWLKFFKVKLGNLKIKVKICSLFRDVTVDVVIDVKSHF